MTPDELRRDEANRWLAIAARDLLSANLLAEAVPANAVFQCQQAAEKSLKAFLTFHNVAFRKTHDLRNLGAQCGEIDDSLREVLLEAEALSEYAVVFRYLDAPREPDGEEARGALDIARRLNRQVRALLANSGFDCGDL